MKGSEMKDGNRLENSYGTSQGKNSWRDCRGGWRDIRGDGGTAEGNVTFLG